MSMKKRAAILAAGVLALATSLPAEAATFNIAFDDVSNGVGADWFGSFDAPATGGAVTNFTATINGKVYDTNFFEGLYGGNLNPICDVTLGILTSIWDDAYFVASPRKSQPAPGLGFITAYDVDLGTTVRSWTIGTCTGSRDSCANVFASNSYRITQQSAAPAPTVPLPAGLPLLAGGSAALGLVRRRKA